MKWPISTSTFNRVTFGNRAVFGQFGDVFDILREIARDQYGLNSFILNNSSYPFMKDIIVTIKSLQLVFPSISVLSSQNFDPQCVILFFGLTEELEKAKMQSYRSVEQLEALSGKYHNKKKVLSRCLIVSFLV